MLLLADHELSPPLAPHRLLDPADAGLVVVQSRLHDCLIHSGFPLLTRSRTCSHTLYMARYRPARAFTHASLFLLVPLPFHFLFRIIAVHRFTLAHRRRCRLRSVYIHPLYHSQSVASFFHLHVESIHDQVTVLLGIAACTAYRALQRLSGCPPRSAHSEAAAAAVSPPRCTSLDAGQTRRDLPYASSIVR